MEPPLVLDFRVLPLGTVRAIVKDAASACRHRLWSATMSAMIELRSVRVVQRRRRALAKVFSPATAPSFPPSSLDRALETTAAIWPSLVTLGQHPAQGSMLATMQAPAPISVI